MEQKTIHSFNIETHLSLKYHLKIIMTNFSEAVLCCIADWGKRSIDCKGDMKCLERSARQLRECLDIAFPDSKKIELESDKVNYMLSSVFFLLNRLSKAIQGLAEFDRALESIENLSRASTDNKENQQIYTKFHTELDEILAKYF